MSNCDTIETSDTNAIEEDSAILKGDDVIEVVESESTKTTKTSTNPSEYDSADSFTDAEEHAEVQSLQEAEAENVEESVEETPITISEDVLEHTQEKTVTPEEHRSIEGTEESADEEEESGSFNLEREQGDGQESVQSKKVDHDEDKKNPQYIPKRGTFYEHDDRTAEEEEAQAAEEDKDKDGKKKIWTDKKERWSHDKFNDSDQAPKSKQELVAIYGYDIRNEEGPPRARRRRRYGRGPNKYTRNWADEDAYNKTVAITKKPIIKNIKMKDKLRSDQSDDPEETDMPQGGSGDNQNRFVKDEANSSRPQSAENVGELRSERASGFTSSTREFKSRTNTTSNTDRYSNKNQQRIGTGRVVKPNRETRDSDYKGFTKPRQIAKSQQAAVDEPPKQIHNRNFVNRNPQDIENDMTNMSLNDQNRPKAGQKHPANNRQGGVPPRLQTEPKGSKRYSRIRQRALPESNNSNFTQQQQQLSYYPNGFPSAQQQTQVSPPQQAPNPQTLMQPIPSTLPQMPAIPPPPLATMSQVPVTSTPLPPQFAPPFPQPAPAFLQPAPPPFLPQQSGAIMNYVQGQQYAPPQAPFQGYQQQFNQVSQPAEIFQPPGGITYYNTQDQQPVQRATIQRRPKAAIPILPPPPLEPRGRGKTSDTNLDLAGISHQDAVDLHSENIPDLYGAVQVQP